MEEIPFQSLGIHSKTYTRNPQGVSCADRFLGDGRSVLPSLPCQPFCLCGVKVARDFWLKALKRCSDMSLWILRLSPHLPWQVNMLWLCKNFYYRRTPLDLTWGHVGAGTAKLTLAASMCSFFAVWATREALCKGQIAGSFVQLWVVSENIVPLVGLWCWPRTQLGSAFLRDLSNVKCQGTPT